MKRIQTKLWQVQHRNGVAADAQQQSVQQHQQLKDCRQGLTALVGTNAFIHQTSRQTYKHTNIQICIYLNPQLVLEGGEAR